MFNLIVKDVETGYTLTTVKDTFTIPCDGEILEIDGGHWNVVTSFYEPSLMGLSTDVHVVWVASADDTNDTHKKENYEQQ